MSEFEFSADGDVGYLQLPHHPGRGTAGCVKRTVRLFDLLPNVSRESSDIILDIDSENRIIGIEVLA